MYRQAKLFSVYTHVVHNPSRVVGKVQQLLEINQDLGEIV